MTNDKYTTGRTFAGWRKSTRSGGGDNCVEVATATDGHIGVRDSKNPRPRRPRVHPGRVGRLPRRRQGRRVRPVVHGP